MAATWNGRPVPSKIVLVFLFPLVMTETNAP